MPFFLSFLLISWLNVWGLELEIPALTSPVVDQGQFLTDAEEKNLSEFIYEIHTHLGPQITILTVNNLQGYAIEDFSIRVAEKWQLGTKKAGNGLLILISKEERKMRIEVGEGIEGEITDYESKQYIRKILAPAFKAGNFHSGLRQVLEEIAYKFSINTNQEGTPLVKRAPLRTNNGLGGFLPVFFLAVVFIHILFRKKPGLRGLFTGSGAAALSYFMLPGAGIAFVIIAFLIGLGVGVIGLSNLLYAMGSSSHHSGGGYGGGSGSSGGWSGGGGGFSGGGSSGDW